MSISKPTIGKIKTLFFLILIIFSILGALRMQNLKPILNVQIPTKEDLDQISRKNESSQTQWSKTPPKINFEIPGIQKDNVAYFNVLEEIQAQAETTSLDINEENHTIEIPEGWNLTSNQMAIDALAQNWNVEQDGNITQPSGSRQWDFLADPMDPLLSWYFAENYGNEALGIEGVTGLFGGTIPNEALAVWGQEIHKPFSDLTIHERERISNGVTKYPLWNDLSSDPFSGDVNDGDLTKGFDWKQLLLNPFGGRRGTATRKLTYNDVDDSLEAYIHAGTSNLTLGNPSIGWQVYFEEPTAPDFIPKKYELITYWKVENLHYEAQDNLSVIMRIDDQYVDGRYDSAGNYYPNATKTTIENSWNNSQYLDHDYVVRTFDITDLMDPQQANHSLDFGIWFEGINETSDEVRVSFGGVFIRAVEEDQYDIGDLGFQCKIDFENQAEMQNWYLFSLFADESDGSSIFVPIGLLQNLFNESADEQYIQLNLTSRLKGLLDSKAFIFYLGIVNFGGERTTFYDFEVKFDDILLDLSYKQENLSRAGFQRWNGTTWLDQSDFIINSTTPLIQNNLTLAFRTTNTTYNESYIDFLNTYKISRNRPDNASASYIIPQVMDTTPDLIHWNVSYNNTDTVTQLITQTYENFNPTTYNFSVLDVPAWDGLGANSTDWEWTGGLDPTGNEPSYADGIKQNGTKNPNNYQNCLVANAINQVDSGNYINGTWILTYTSQNYLSNASLVHQDTVLHPSRFYDGESAIIHINQSIGDITESAINGAYNLSLYDPEGTQLTNFPKYQTNVEGNLSESWNVEDLGIGNYRIYATWNDSSSEVPEVTRIGIILGNFEIWRPILANLTAENSVINSGALGDFKFNLTDGFTGLPISNAETYIDLYRNTTNNKWGTDWPPYQYLLDDIEENTTDNAEGNYTLAFKSRSVPTGDYEIYIKIMLPFYEEFFLYSWINITGFPMKLEILNGAVKTSMYRGYVIASNLPRVNDSTSCTIKVNVTHLTDNTALTGGQISGKFNGSDQVFYGIDLYSQTQRPSDKGLYNITIDAQGLDTTERLDVYNYSLILTASINGYNSSYVNLTTRVLPISTRLMRNGIAPLYEESSLDFYITYENINNLGNPLLLKNGNLTWQIYNSDLQNVAEGNLSQIIAGVYSINIDFSEEGFHLPPGIYSFVVNASQLNCAPASWVQDDFQILAKADSQIELIVSEFLQIGSELNLQANLSYTNSSPIVNSEVQIILQYKDAEPLQIFKTTNELGLIYYSQIIPNQYADSYLNISAFYQGTSTIQNSSQYIVNKFVKGKNEVNLSLAVNSEIRVGYSVTLSGWLSIESYTDYEDIFITIAAWVDGNSQNLVFIQQIYVNSSGYFSFESVPIPNGYSTVTFFADYAGTAVNQYASAVIHNNPILAKWATEFHIINLEPIYRIGQQTMFNVSANYVNESCPLTFYTESIYIIYEYEGIDPLISQAWYGTTNYVAINYEIPQYAGTWLNVTIQFSGNSTVQGFSYTYTLTIWDKWDTDFIISNMPESLRQGYTISYAINATFVNASCPETLNGLEAQITVYFDEEILYLTDTSITNGRILLSYQIPYDSLVTWMNISIVFGGTLKIAGFWHIYNYSVEPQWIPEVTMGSLPDAIHQGQEVDFILIGEFSDPACPESISAISVQFSLQLGDTQRIFNGSFDINGRLIFNYTIPSTQATLMQITCLTFQTPKIAAISWEEEYSILPRIITTLTILDSASKQDYSGEFTFSVKLQDEEGNPIPEQTLYFDLKSTTGELIAQQTAITNQEGIATISFEINEVGDYEIDPHFQTSSIYQGTSVVDNPNIQYSIRVVNTWIILWDNIIWIVVGIVTFGILSASVYRGIYVPRRNKQRAAMAEIHRRFADIENMQYMLIIHKHKGLSIFSQSFTEIPIDENLISGFLSAISSFGQEIGSKVKQENQNYQNLGPKDKSQGLEELAYKQFKIVVKDGEIIRTAVLLLKSPSDSLKRKVEAFNNAFESAFIETLQNWRGQELPKEPIVEIVEKKLHADLLYPHNVIIPKVANYMKSLRPKQCKALIIKEAQNSFQGTFKVRDMIMKLASYGKKEVDTFNSIHELRADGIVFAVNPRTQALITEFKPYIDSLTKELRIALQTLEMGVKNKKDLQRKTQIAVIEPVIAKLEHLEMIDENLQLTPHGEIIATLTSMIPDF